MKSNHLFVSQTRYLQSMMGALALLMLGAVGAPGAIAQVTNQSDVTGANPDIIYAFPVDFPGLVEAINNVLEPGQTAQGLADEIGDAYDACMSMYETDDPEAHLAGYNPCERLNELIEQADEVLNTANQQWEQYYQEGQTSRVW